MENRIEQLESALRTLELRNARVEANKDWETSRFRKLTIAAMTYVVVGLFLLSMHVANPQLHALVPTTGYLLSTLSLPAIKRWWLKHRG